MAIIKPPVLPTWADSGDKVQPSNVEIATGWPVTNVPPSRQRFNWFFNYVMNGVRYFSRRGLPDWDAVESYMTGDVIIGDDNLTYRSLINSNLNHVPSTSPSQWRGFGMGIGSGTTMAFFQAAAPTGWTQVTTHNDKALRIVSGVGGGSGGSVAYSTVFSARTLSGTVGGTALTEAQMPSHVHTAPLGTTDPTGSPIFADGAAPMSAQVGTTNATGGGQTHTHSFTSSDLGMAVKYVDMILATQD